LLQLFFLINFIIYLIQRIKLYNCNVILILILMFYNVKIKKWEQDHNYYAKIWVYNTNDEIEYLIKSNSKNDFNKKIYKILKNSLVLKN
jgi:hypothetical protein